MQLTVREFIDNEGSLQYLTSGIRITEKDLESLLFHDINFLKAIYDTNDKTTIFDYLISHIHDLDKIRIFHRSLTVLSKRINLKITVEYYESFVSKFLEDRQFNILYINWVNSNYDPWKNPTLDHIIPLSKGGTNDIENFQYLTYIENQLKSNWLPNEWNLIKSNFVEYVV